MNNEFEVKILEKLDRMESKIDTIETEVTKHTGMIKENKKAIEKNTRMIAENRDKINKNSLEITGLTEVVTAHNNTLIKFENDFNEKFRVLFDSFSANNDKHKAYDDNISKLNAKIFNHDIRISSLEDLSKKVRNA